MNRSLALAALFFLGCASDTTDGGRLGSEGDSCLRTADCAAPLRCAQNVCSPTASGDTGAGDEVAATFDSDAVGDGAAPGAGTDGTGLESWVATPTP